MNLRPKQIQIAVVTLAVLAVLTWKVSIYLGRYQPFADLIEQSQSSPNGNLSIAIVDATVLRRLSGHRKLRLHAEEVEMSRDRRTITASGITDSYVTGVDDLPILRFTAGRANVTTGYGGMGGAFHGTVLVTGGANVMASAFPQPALHCDSLTWDSETNQVTCPGLMSVDLPGYGSSLTGQNFTLDTRSGDMAVSHIHGVFHLSNAVQ